MSRRRRRDPEPPRAAGDRREPRGARDARQPPAARGSRHGRLVRDLLILLAAFGVGVGVAELLGAANLGVAFGVGQVVFAIVLVVLLTRD